MTNYDDDSALRVTNMSPETGILQVQSEAWSPCHSFRPFPLFLSHCLPGQRFLSSAVSRACFLSLLRSGRSPPCLLILKTISNVLVFRPSHCLPLAVSVSDFSVQLCCLLCSRLLHAGGGGEGGQHEVGALLFTAFLASHTHSGFYFTVKPRSQGSFL